jgi:hypothetical protein
MGIVQLAVREPYTFIVAALSVLIVSLLVILRTPTDIFPNINIPIVSIVWQHTEAIGRRIKRTSRRQSLDVVPRFQNGFECLRERIPALRPKGAVSPYVKLILNALCK